MRECKPLRRLLNHNIKVLAVQGDLDVEIQGIEFDSRKVQENYLFVAVCGTNTDGHTYISNVVAAGARAVICERMPNELDANVTYVQVADSASALGNIASEWYDNPSQKLTLTGVTGTNGKTTTATLLYEMARLCGYKAGLLSTVCNYVDDIPVDATQTTPDPITINRLLAQMVDCGCSYAFMEVSSHAAVQCRIDGLTFRCGIFTNLTRDHLDYHKTTQNYIAAKKRFFDMLPDNAVALINSDDPNGKVMVQSSRAKVKTYSMRTMADYRGKILESRLDGTLLEFNGREIEVVFVGTFNAYNLLAVFGAANIIGFPQEKIAPAISRLVPVAGRFQTFSSPAGYYAIVDYAHTPDALKNVLATVRDVTGRGSRIITVVGAGGNRDAGKRPLMAKEAAAHSDLLILTSDNPRNEKPEDIIAEMAAGVPDNFVINTLEITDRRQAIHTALKMARRGDVVVVAGKGHENYQEIAGVRHHFDDREIVCDFINKHIEKKK